MPLRPRRRRLLALTALTVLIALLLAANAIVPFKVVMAGLKSKDGFTNCTGDARIRCEPGSEALAIEIAPHLDAAVATVERAQFGRFSRPIHVHTYATIDSFAAHTGYSHPDAPLSTTASTYLPERRPPSPWRCCPMKCRTFS